jgi:phosphoribosylcarboxyaminoimidazole (NCAIR) mutase
MISDAELKRIGEKMTQVAVVMGSTSDWESMKQTDMLLEELVLATKST